MNIDELIAWYMARYPSKLFELLDLNAEVQKDSEPYDADRLEDLCQGIVNPEAPDYEDKIDWSAYL
jgi:hypothetical protein